MADEIKFNTGFNGCNDRMAILKNELVPRRMESLPEIGDGSEVTDNDYIYVDSDNLDKKIRVSTLLNSERIQSDWSVEDETKSAFIRNKPGCDNLEEDMVALYNIGGIKAGHVFSKGTSVRDIIDMMLSLNNQGYFLRHTVDYNPEEITEEQLIEFDTVSTNRIPLTTDILSNGYQWEIHPDNEYFFIAINDIDDIGIKVEKIKQAGFDIGLKYQRVGSYRVWYFDQPSKGNFILTVLFKNEV